LIDRELYLPVSWTGDRDRCGEAGIGEEVEFATKPELARRMLARARDAGAVFGWFTADEAYGDNPGLRTYLEAQDIDYVMAISCDQRFPPRPGGCAPTNSQRWPRSGDGSACPPARAAKDSASMTGYSSTPETTTTNCWSAAPSANPTSWPTTSSTAVPQSR
jgi:DDE superfamily endonuclease